MPGLAPVVMHRSYPSPPASGLIPASRIGPSSITLSVRTVEGNVYRCCAKLGLSDRIELAHLVSESHATAWLQQTHSNLLAWVNFLIGNGTMG